MNPALRKELPIIAIVLLPFIYLGYIWNELPAEVPIHWNLEGEIDGYGKKGTLVLVPIMLPLLIYIMLSIIPKIDPKNRLNQMGDKLQNLKLILTLCMSVLALFIIYSSKNQSFTNQNYPILGMGVLFAVIGNYFQAIKPNYFFGIRTPWTLESEVVWKETHKLAGKMWLLGGIIVIFSSLVFERQFNFNVFLTVMAIIALVPMVYSYIKFNSEKKSI
jgi:uncharacterized membrane protein